MPVIGRLMRCGGEGGPCTPYLPRQSVQNFRVKTHVSPGRQAWAIYESCRRLPGRPQVALPLIGLQRMWDPPRAVWLAAALLAGLCSIDTRGTRCFRVCHTHWTEPSTLLRPASVLSHPSSILHLQQNQQSASSTPPPATRRSTATIPLDKMLDLDDYQEGPAPDASLRWRPRVAPRQRNQRAMGRHSTVTGRLVAALSITLRQEQQDSDDVHIWPIHELPDPMV